MRGRGRERSRRVLGASIVALVANVAVGNIEDLVAAQAEAYASGG
jgi:hypothetical protein